MTVKPRILYNSFTCKYELVLKVKSRSCLECRFFMCTRTGGPGGLRQCVAKRSKYSVCSAASLCDPGIRFVLIVL